MYEALHGGCLPGYDALMPLISGNVGPEAGARRSCVQALVYLVTEFHLCWLLSTPVRPTPFCWAGPSGLTFTNIPDL